MKLLEKKRQQRAIRRNRKWIKDARSKYRDASKLFYTHHYLGEGSNWADIYFPGQFRGSKCLWNATIITVKHAYLEAVENKALEMNELPYGDTQFEKMDNGYSRMVFDEQTEKWNQHTNELEEQLFESGEIKVQPGYEAEEGYHLGIGIMIIVDAQWLTNEIIEAAIARLQKEDIRDYDFHSWGQPRSYTKGDIMESVNIAAAVI